MEFHSRRCCVSVHQCRPDHVLLRAVRSPLSHICPARSGVLAAASRRQTASAVSVASTVARARGSGTAVIVADRSRSMRAALACYDRLLGGRGARQG